LQLTTYSKSLFMTVLSITKNEIINLLKKYNDVTVGELRSHFGIQGKEISALTWTQQRIYLPLPLSTISILSELYREGKIDITKHIGLDNIYHLESQPDYFIFKQPTGALLLVNGRLKSLKGRYVTATFKLR
ncbi:MAG: hypothetical protein QME81_20130, partial [bacterium]|nr:hypothetical protein [bacterium]